MKAHIYSNAKTDPSEAVEVYLSVSLSEKLIDTRL